MSNLTYEQAFKRLEEIVEMLESGTVELDKSMKLFEEGTHLADFCNKKLNEAQQKFTVLTNGNSQVKNDD